MQGITCRMRIGCQWNALPRTFGSSTPGSRSTPGWGYSGKLHKRGLLVYDEAMGIDRGQPEGSGEVGGKAEPAVRRAGVSAGPGGQRGQPARPKKIVNVLLSLELTEEEL